MWVFFFSCRLLNRDEYTFFAVPAYDPVLTHSYFPQQTKLLILFSTATAPLAAAVTASETQEGEESCHTTLDTTRATRLALRWTHTAIFFPGLVSARKWHHARMHEEIGHRTLFGSQLQTRWWGCIPFDITYVNTGYLIQASCLGFFHS